MKCRQLWHLLILFGVMAFIHDPVCLKFFPSIRAAGAAENSAASFFSESDAPSAAMADNDAVEEKWEEDDSGFEDDSELDDSGFDDDWELAFAQPGPVENDSLPVSWRLDAALKNHVNTDRELDFRDASKKNEVGLRLETTWGAPPYYFFAVTDAYFFPTFLHEEIGDDHPYSPESKTYKNLRITTRDSEMIFREMYVNWNLSGYRLRIGNQLFPWGTADFMNSTAYFNPTDSRELIFKPQDEVRFGIPACSVMFFFDAFTMELVFTPFHVPSALPSTGHFWAVKQIENEYPLIFGDHEELPSSSRNFGYGGRVSATRSGVDFSFSAYHGPDKDQLLVPFATVIEENQPISLFVQPQSFLVDYVGADVAFTHGDFVFQAEAVFSPNKRGVVRQDTSRPQDLTFPYDTRKTRYYAYSLGFNYFIPMHKLISGHAGESLFTAEWYQARYDDDEINRPLITDFLTLRFQDSFFDDRFKVSLTQVTETRNNGVVWWPQIGYDFKNGFEIELAYIDIQGRGRGDVSRDSLFYYFKKNDFIMVNFRYAFF